MTYAHGGRHQAVPCQGVGGVSTSTGFSLYCVIRDTLATVTLSCLGAATGVTGGQRQAIYIDSKWSSTVLVLLQAWGTTVWYYGGTDHRPALAWLLVTWATRRCSPQGWSTSVEAAGWQSRGRGHAPALLEAVVQRLPADTVRLSCPGGMSCSAGAGSLSSVAACGGGPGAERIKRPATVAPGWKLSLEGRVRVLRRGREQASSRRRRRSRA